MSRLSAVSEIMSHFIADTGGPLSIRQVIRGPTWTKFHNYCIGCHISCVDCVFRNTAAQKCVTMSTMWNKGHLERNIVSMCTVWLNFFQHPRRLSQTSGVQRHVFCNSSSSARSFVTSIGCTAAAGFLSFVAGDFRSLKRTDYRRAI